MDSLTAIRPAFRHPRLLISGSLQIRRPRRCPKTPDATVGKPCRLDARRHTASGMPAGRARRWAGLHFVFQTTTAVPCGTNGQRSRNGPGSPTKVASRLNCVSSFMWISKGQATVRQLAGGCQVSPPMSVSLAYVHSSACSALHMAICTLHQIQSV